MEHNMEHNETEGKKVDTQESSEKTGISDAYICIFFDGTGNNMYEQLNKGDHLKELQERAIAEHPTTKLFSASPTLFTSFDPESSYFVDYYSKKAAKSAYDISNYGMDNYLEQKYQAEDDFTINEDKGGTDSKDMTNNNGGLKYSNVAILRSLTKKKEKEEYNGKVCIKYNLYIEGSGKHWDTGMSPVGLGMGTGRTGVVGLVSKALVFVQDFLDSSIEQNNRGSINLHFAIFGFSRGSTCGRVFTYLVTDDPNSLPRIHEFKQYLPNKYYKDDKLCFLDKYTNKTVDFLGIYDTVSSIGFLQKDDNSTNYGLNDFVLFEEKNGKKWYVNKLHGPGYDTKDMLLTSTLPQVEIPKALAAAGSKLFFGDAKWNFHRFNVTNYGLYSHHSPQVKHTFHICAMDEFRENFALVDLGTNLDRCTEVFMPGCHSDIGGGLMKDDDIDRYTLRRIIDGKPAKMNSSSDPRIIKPTDKLSTSILSQLGWLCKATPTIEQAPSPTLTQGKSKVQSFLKTLSQAMEPEAVTYTKAIEKQEKEKRRREDNIKNGNEGMATLIDESDKKIEFERFALEGYSNITLEMMIKRALGNHGLSVWPPIFRPFKHTIPTRFKVDGNKGLEDIRDHMLKINVDKIAEGETKWYIPKQYNYRFLRKNYLHFSCTDELNWEKFHWGATGANLGNPPCWRKSNDDSYYLLTRIVYKGDKGDNELHYINDDKRKSS